MMGILEREVGRGTKGKREVYVGGEASYDVGKGREEGMYA